MKTVDLPELFGDVPRNFHQRLIYLEHNCQCPSGKPRRDETDTDDYAFDQADEPIEDRTFGLGGYNCAGGVVSMASASIFSFSTPSDSGTEVMVVFSDLFVGMIDISPGEMCRSIRQRPIVMYISGLG